MTFLPQDFATAAMNGQGRVVGTGIRGAAIWDGSSVFSLGSTLPASEGLAINGLGQIAGRTGSRGFFYEDGVVTEIGPTDPPWYWTCAAGINDVAQLTGTMGADSAGVSQQQRAERTLAGIWQREAQRTESVVSAERPAKGSPWIADLCAGQGPERATNNLHGSLPLCPADAPVTISLTSVPSGWLMAKASARAKDAAHPHPILLGDAGAVAEIVVVRMLDACSVSNRTPPPGALPKSAS